MVSKIKIREKSYLSLLIKFLLLFEYINICGTEKDTDYSLKLRLNNGNYIMLTIQGIYIYSQTLTSKLDIKIFDSRIYSTHSDCYSTNMAQFSSEDNGYVICLIQNMTYIVSKNGIFLTEYKLDFMYKGASFPIIPYGHSGNEYYYLIVSKVEKRIIFRKYIYNSSLNSVVYVKAYTYELIYGFYNSIACELMYYSNNKVVTCFYGDWETTFLNVFNMSDFMPISGLGGSTLDGGQHFVSAIKTPGRTKAAFSSQHTDDLIAYYYHIETNYFIKIDYVAKSGCDCEQINMNIEYFPEREEFFFYCIGTYKVYSARLSKDNYYKLLPIVNLINTTSCGFPHIFNLGYSSKVEKYFIYTDADCQQLFSIDNIEAKKYYDYPTDEPGVLICDYFYNYNKTDCYDKVPDGFYCNDTYLKTIDKCHSNCRTCKEGPTTNNNNCLTCKFSKYLDLGNCVDNCTNGYFIDVDNITKCKCSSNISCKYCSKESKRYNLCETCNNDIGYYPKINDETNINNSIINCYNNETIDNGYYLNIKTKYYENCYLTCKKCSGLGDEKNNKCIECISTHEFKTNLDNINNCYEKCDNYYFFDFFNIFHCTKNNTCPLNYSKLVISKNKCIDNCTKDNYNKYEYQNICYGKCPFNTRISNKYDYICKESIEEKCKVMKKKLQIYKKELSINDINPLIEEYTNNYIDTDDHVSIYENYLISVYIYKNIFCLKNTTNSAPQIDFNECYEKIVNYYNISESIVISIINIKIDSNSKPITKYALFHPESGELLNNSEICANKTIIIQEDVVALMEKTDYNNKGFIIFWAKQGIDVFNISDEFYHDLCYHFESPNGRDIPLKDRIKMFYPNISLCNIGCEFIGVDLQSLKAKCICIFNDFMNNNIFTDSIYGQNFQEFVDVMNSLNIAALQCFEDIFVKEYFIKCYGAFIFLGLFLCKIISSSKFLYNGLFYINNYLFCLSESYITYIQNENNEISNFPPKKIKTQNNLINLNQPSFPRQRNHKSSTRSYNSSNRFINDKKSKTFLFPTFKLELKSINQSKKDYNSKTNKKTFLKSKINTNINLQAIKESINIKEYISSSFDENDFDDVIDNEKRTFCQFSYEKFKENLIIINLFWSKEPLSPRSLKILILFITIELYFVTNALFYTEDYLSEILCIEEKDSFFAFVLRRINHFIYIYTIVGIIKYIIGYLFLEEKKIKKILIRNKNEKIKINYKISKVVKKMKIRFYLFIIFSNFLTIIFFLYISCFNIIYPNTKVEWIKSSLFILILNELINFILTLIECSIRYIAIKCNSNKLFNLSLLFAKI